ncbi:MAG: tRNA (adenosine(37)-N6)-threonylcarbamoyltransferase complex dimerization subunit type 1 TsaB [Dehalococcoidales bacterium]|nr:tRNA (adenosine(37)-N6)-threonylcarbamoyltransferase complex dimerization subunit type 1 TsaB [Dehalococcoidales bacterium]
MKILGIDTSGYANAVSVIDGDRTLADTCYPAKSDSLEKIVAHIDGALQGARLKLEDIDGIGVGVGPGSWTGIRVGVTVGKILAYSTGNPVAGISTLSALAYAARESALSICAIISAGTKNTVYAAFFQEGKQLGEYYVGDISGLASLIKEPTMLVSAQAQYYREILVQAMNDSPVPLQAIDATPSGSAIARLAAQRLERGDSDDTLALAPLYLKESTARAYIGRYMRTETKGS